MADSRLFAKHDIFHVIERFNRRISAEYLDLTDDEAMSEDSIQRLKAKFLLDVPVLGEPYAVQGTTKIDGRKIPGRISFSGRTPSMEEVPEITVHVPFTGDGGIFNISPSANNGGSSHGEIVGKELLFRLVVWNSGTDVQGEIDRRLQQINWSLMHIKEKNAHISQELETVIRQAMMARKRSIESRQTAIGGLRIPIRQAAAPQAATPPPKPPARATAPVRDEAPKRDHWDVFVSHASADKDYVRPLVKALTDAGISVWYDENNLEWGDNLRGKISEGLVKSTYALVVLSKKFLAVRKWTEHELDGLFAKEEIGRTVILPIWHGIKRADLLDYSPALADRLAKMSDTDDPESIAGSVLKMLGRAPAGTEVTPTPAAPSKVIWPGFKNPAISYCRYTIGGTDPREVSMYIRIAPSVLEGVMDFAPD